MKRTSSLMAAAVVLCPALGWAQNTGAEAFAAQDFSTAAQLWQQEANAGSAKAMLGLGLLVDRGFGGTRDVDVAFEWYAKAAALGLAEAQFNLAIMYDGGLGRPRDATRAAMWYTRAALRGHARAQYNLGLLYETGDGITANNALAMGWFDAAADDIPAAAQKDLPDATGSDALVAPTLSFGQAGPGGAEVTWTATTTTPQTYLVEVVNAPSQGIGYSAPVLAQETELSGVLADIATQSSALWRVSAINAAGDAYDPSQWQGSADVMPPRGRITLQSDAKIPAMMLAATLFAADLREAGYWVRIDDVATNADYITYGFTSDAVMASVVANYLPQRDVPALAAQSVASTQPGEIIVNLAAFR